MRIKHQTAYQNAKERRQHGTDMDEGIDLIHTQNQEREEQEQHQIGNTTPDEMSCQQGRDKIEKERVGARSLQLTQMEKIHPQQDAQKDTEQVAFGSWSDMVQPLCACHHNNCNLNETDLEVCPYIRTEIFLVELNKFGILE